MPGPITVPSLNTPISGGAPYCSPAQFLTWFDLRSAADYLSDSGTALGAIPNTQPIQINPAAVIGSTVLLSILQAASGTLEAAVMIGDRYTPGDLILLTTGAMATSNMASLIAQIVAGIAAPVVIRRRPDLTAPKMPIIEESQKYLEALANGEAIFGLQEVMDAGKEFDYTETLPDVMKRNLPSWSSRRMIGRRAKWQWGFPPCDW